MNTALNAGGIILLVFLFGFVLFLVTAFLIGSREGQMTLGIAVLALSWVWRHVGYVFVVLMLFLVVRDLTHAYEKRERLAEARHEQILKALDQIRQELRKLGDRVEQQSGPSEQGSSRYDDPKYRSWDLLSGYKKP